MLCCLTLALGYEEQIFDCISILEHMDKLFCMVYTEISPHH